MYVYVWWAWIVELFMWNSLWSKLASFFHDHHCTLSFAISKIEAIALIFELLWKILFFHSENYSFIVRFTWEWKHMKLYQHQHHILNCSILLSSTNEVDGSFNFLSLGTTWGGIYSNVFLWWFSEKVLVEDSVMKLSTMWWVKFFLVFLYLSCYSYSSFFPP